MPEDLAFHDIGREGATIQRDEGPVLVGPLLVDGPRHQFLAGSGFAGDEDRLALPRDPGKGMEHGQHGRRSTDHSANAPLGIELEPERQILRAQGAKLRQTLQRGFELAGLEGLHQIVVRAQPDRLDGGRDGGESGHEHDVGAAIAGRNGSQQVNPVHAGHSHVAEHDIDLVLVQSGQCVWRGLYNQHSVPGLGCHLAAKLHHASIVIDHQNRHSASKLATATCDCRMLSPAQASQF